jgi:hypothetical protein
MKKSPAGTARGPARAAKGDFALAGHRDAGQFGGRVGMGKTAPDRATIADLVMRDMRDRRVQQRMARCQPLIVLDVTPAYERAEPEAVIADGNIAEPRQPPQIDQQARGRQAESENRHQALSARDHQRLGVRREQVDCLAKSAGSLVIEGGRFHRCASRGKTGPEQSNTAFWIADGPRGVEHQRGHLNPESR